MCELSIINLDAIADLDYFVSETARRLPLAMSGKTPASQLMIRIPTAGHS